jgi:hypothetical protein
VESIGDACDAFEAKEDIGINADAFFYLWR